MKRFVKFVCLPSGERRLLISALFSLIATRVALWLFHFDVLFKRLPVVAMVQDQNDLFPPERIAWAVSVVSRYLPGMGNCLVQAFATQAMLARRGNRARIRIGVVKDKIGKLKAHAWVECGEKIVIGGGGVSQYVVFPPWGIQR